MEGNASGGRARGCVGRRPPVRFAVSGADQAAVIKTTRGTRPARRILQEPAPGATSSSVRVPLRTRLDLSRARRCDLLRRRPARAASLAWRSPVPRSRAGPGLGTQAFGEADEKEG